MNAAPAQKPLTKRKWRPSLSLIVFVALATVLVLPLAGLFFFRIYENQLVRQTEAELIAQSAALAAGFRRAFESRTPADAPLGAVVLPPTANSSNPTARQIEPGLDLLSEVVLPQRPEARAPVTPARPQMLAIGALMAPDLIATQQVTLAGFRLLDANGVVIAGREEIGLSLAHVEEIAQALRGKYHSVTRARVFLNDPPPIYSMSRSAGVRVFTALPVISRDHVIGVVYASRTPLSIFKHLFDQRRNLFLAALAAIALTILTGFILHRTITSPVRALMARTSAIGNGDRNAMRPLERHGTAEFAALSESFLEMAAKLHARSDFIATFAAHVSHELKSPLTSIQGAAELMRDEIGAATPAMSDADRRKFLDNIVADTDRLTAIVQRLRELARAENAPTQGATHLREVVEDLRSTFQNLRWDAQGEFDEVIAMTMENARIVFTHLADNSARHGATQATLSAMRRGTSLHVTFRDDGGGVSPNNRARIFESFFTTRRESGGTGMGLPIVRAMLEAHGGAIAIIDSEAGAAFELTLPLAIPEPARS